MEQILGWIDQNQTLAIVIAAINIIIFFLSIKRTTTKIFASSRGVAIGGNSNAPIITGDINSNRSGLLGALANIATILGFLVGAATLYVSYLALTKAG
ncbi:hypothetical protein Sbal175_4387 (plasmid) [Shewanella baltica BA175]|uniref:hypothetical protein n=1 Tax=Shewanella baltica TaxID=62322 RepID=UPI0001E4E198|nr:hypothetical protein [Shewanella baltica]AEG13599.1 hypothetical protein Sbal175_4387 [Shewanella baltica BA175]